MKIKLLLTLLVMLMATQFTNAQIGDWIAGDETVAPANPVPSLGTCTVSGSYTWLSFDTFNNANHLAILSYALPPCVDASTGTPTLSYLNNTPVVGVTFAQVGSAYQATLPGNLMLDPGTKVVFAISGLQVYDNQSYAGQQASHSISYVVAPNGDQSANNLATIIFSTLQGAAPLPVSGLDFDATLVENGQNAKVQLDWKPQTENNSDYYEVQRSADGIDWEDIGEKVTGAGNSSTELSYQTFDNDPLLGVSYYRLKNVDFNKNSFLSETRKVVYRNGSGSVKFYPNPTKDNLNVEVQINDRSLIEIKLVSIQGRVVQSVTAWVDKGTNTLKMDLSALTNGVYEVSVFNNNSLMQSGKVFKK